MNEDETKKEGECESCKELEKKNEQCESEKNEYLLGWQRTKADFQNYKKEESARTEMMIKFGNELFIRELLGVMSSFELGLSAVKGNEAAEKGISLIKSQLEDILRKAGLEKINVKQGEHFDPNTHEALLEVASSEVPSECVLEEMEKGYTLHGKVIRPAKVKISKGPEVKE